MTKNINQAIDVLKSNGLIIFPSDTVWGVGCLLNPVAVAKLYSLKQREPNKPTGIYVKDWPMALNYGKFNAKAEALAREYWPGALSVVVEATSLVDPLIMGQTNTVSLRIPDHPLILNLLEKLNQPLVQTSANFAGQAAPVLFTDIDPNFTRAVDFVLEGESHAQLASTVIDATSEQIKVLRPGPIKIE